MVLLAVVAVAVVAVAVALAVGGGGGGGKGGGGKSTAAARQIRLLAATAPGPDPFTPSVADDSLPTDVPTPTAGASPGGELGAPAVAGSTPGLYGGHRGVSSCGVSRLTKLLTADPVKAKAFAGVVGIDASAIPSYLHGLTPVLLRADTRVTDYGYRGSSAVAFPAVFERGTAILAGPHGLPRLRCPGGNPLQPPPATDGPETFTGSAWSSFRAADVIAVAPASHQLTQFVIYDPDHGTWFIRPVGTTGAQDRPRSAPATPAPTATRTTRTAAPTTSSSPSVSPSTSPPTTPASSAS
ncbi:MAG: hypothetical protein QOF84_2844 [Streptomyces sp.]|jgi:hypothetical protein|nr:hypothetical protein [Streptomyces sp.]